MQIDLPVQSKLPVVLGGLDGAYPSYFVYGPLVFSTATREYLARPDPRRKRRAGPPG